VTMLAIRDQLRNPLLRVDAARTQSRVAAAFSELPSGAQLDCLALRRSLDSRPAKFFEREVYRVYLDWLQMRGKSHKSELQTYLRDEATSFNRALVFLREINSEGWHDRPLSSGDEYDLVRFIDRHIHSAYQRLVEAVLAPLARPIAYFARLDRGAGTDGLDVWNVIQELQSSASDCIARPYRHIVRNGIAHGGITYLQNEIRYRDKNGNEETVTAAAMVRLCDDLVDTCNALATALRVFFLTVNHEGYVTPRELLVEELQEETTAPWWTIEGCVESEIADGRQLIVYARPESRDYTKVQWSAIQSGILAEYFAPGYDRYFLSLKSSKAWHGWAAFDGLRLRQLRESGADDLADYSGVLEDNLVFYVPTPGMPRVIGKLDTLLTSYRINMPTAVDQIRQNFEIPRIVCRGARVHRNLWGAVLGGEVVLEDIDGAAAVDVIRKHHRRIIHAAAKGARGAAQNRAAGLLPLGFAQIAVFRRDYRSRRLAGFGLGSDLICTVRLQRLARIRMPDILGAAIETRGPWRVAWNRAWLEDCGLDLDASHTEES
jgi:hypothetical protein